MKNLPNINLYNHTKKVFEKIIENSYESQKKGYFDFPTKEKWLKEEWTTFKQNNPELCGLKYDKQNKDWVHEYQGGLIRTVINEK